MDKFEKYKDIHNNINEYKHMMIRLTMLSL